MIDEKERIERLLESVNYWIGVASCDCSSDYPIGSCEQCDLRDIREYLEERLKCI